MPEPTIPVTGVAQGAPSDEERVLKFLSQPEGQGGEPQADKSPEDPNPPREAEQPQGQAAEELTPDDLESEGQVPAQPAVDAFEVEVVHNGAQIKLNRADTIKYAQQGLDATRKWEAAAEKDRHATQRLQILSEVDQVRPHLQQQEAYLSGLASQLSQYQQVNWVQLAQQDPVGYAPVRAQYDTLVEQFRQAKGQYDHAYSQVSQRIGYLKSQQLLQEDQRTAEFIPEWSDSSKKAAGKQQVVKWLEGYGVSPQVAGRKLDDAFSMAVAWKAMKYDQLLKAKGDKLKQLRTAPPVTVPGARTTTGKADTDRTLSAKLRKTGSVEDAAALLLNRM